MNSYNFFKTKRKSGTKLLRPMGFEFTFEKKGEVCDEYSCDFDYDPKIEELKRKGYAGYDDGCLEINSPIFIYMEDVLDFWKKLVKDVGTEFVTRNPTSTGGGTHIHVGISKKINSELTKEDRLFRKKLISLLWKMPWLTYAFQDPSDDYSSEPICEFKHQEDKFDLYESLEACVYNANKLRSLGQICMSPTKEPELGNKSTSIRIDETHKTIELRFFDTVDTVEDLKCHILVANRLIDHAIRRDDFSYYVDTVEEKDLIDALLDGSFLREYRDFMADIDVKHTENKILTRMDFEREKIPKATKNIFIPVHQQTIEPVSQTLHYFFKF